MSWLQGEFVSTSRLEATYAGNSDLIHQMYIYGSGLRSYLLAAVVPSERESCPSSHIAARTVHLQHWKLACFPVSHPSGRDGQKWRLDETPPLCWVVPRMCATALENIQCRSGSKAALNAVCSGKVSVQWR